MIPVPLVSGELLDGFTESWELMSGVAVVVDSWFLGSEAHDTPVGLVAGFIARTILEPLEHSILGRQRI